MFHGSRNSFWQSLRHLVQNNMLKFLLLLSISSEIQSLSINCVCRNATYNAVLQSTVYSCFINDLNISSHEEVTNVSRKHEIRKMNSDVKLLAIHNQTVDELPDKLGSYFVNVDGLEVIRSGLKTIKEEDLKDLRNLKYLNLMQNELECLPKNLFENNLMLRTVIICCNLLKVIPPAILEPSHLQYIDFRRNVCVSKKAENGKEVAGLWREITNKCPPSIEVYCTFGKRDFPAGTYYACVVRFWIVVIDYLTVESFQGRHDGGQNCNVKGLRVDEMTTKFLPTNLAYHFPKLSAIEVIGGRMMRLEKRDLKPFPYLKVLWLPRNDIETLSSDVFKGNLLLEKISFYENRLKFIESGIFKPLKHLQFVNFEFNECIDRFASSANCIGSVEEEMNEHCQSAIGK